VGLAVVAFFVALALFAPWIAPHDPLATSWSAVRKAPSAAHWFGTDEIGRDVLSRIIWGARASLLAGLVSVGISLADRRARGVDRGLRRRMDRHAHLAHNRRDARVSRSSSSPSPRRIPGAEPHQRDDRHRHRGHARVRAPFARAVLAVKVEDYIEAARAVGNSGWRIALRHVFPNIVRR
jgi:peptide/nickel transport system permease protein